MRQSNYCSEIPEWKKSILITLTWNTHKQMPWLVIYVKVRLWVSQSVRDLVLRYLWHTTSTTIRSGSMCTTVSAVLRTWAEGVKTAGLTGASLQTDFCSWAQQGPVLRHSTYGFRLGRLTICSPRVLEAHFSCSVHLSFCLLIYTAAIHRLAQGYTSVRHNRGGVTFLPTTYWLYLGAGKTDCNDTHSFFSLNIKTVLSLSWWNHSGITAPSWIDIPIWINPGGLQSWRFPKCPQWWHIHLYIQSSSWFKTGFGGPVMWLPRCWEMPTFVCNVVQWYNFTFSKLLWSAKIL